MRTILALVLALAGTSASNASPSKPKCTAGPCLRHWPEPAARALDAMIAANAHNGSYAIFDMDNTSYQFDLEESLLPFLENRGVLTRETLDPSLKLVPFRDAAGHRESLYSYYRRLCDVDDALCYPFAAQVFSGIPLRRLKAYVDELMALNDTVPTTYYESDVLTYASVSPPRIFPGQVELYNKLMNNGIAVYVVSAASEELVRMVPSDPKYGYNVPPQNVIGVTLLMQNQAGGGLTSARKQIAAGTYNETANLDLVMTPFLWTPATWKAGKWAAVLAYISEWKRPVLAGGDTPDSDGPMIFHGVDVARGGIHLWVNRKDEYMAQLDGMRRQFAADQKREGVPVTADKNWVVVTPEDIL
ncbi:hypothetical protein TOPH_01944 [Tolypocladium ophioglossoides CBS 100239]|uniref:Phosphorylcholine phosphatase n=1 Tax=Tolypocladium ophioglossoides (strain CBS 100239) TaxID=1163406 RepID=A0A0L0NIL4_TOLOC|nr:hypothetical protein TOPH_01944 [Tolypocladium ophioglossoides CBS 100239]